MLFYDRVNATVPDGIEHKTAHIIGGGLAGLAAAAFLATDAHMPAANITVYEDLPTLGGSMDGTGDAVTGYVNRGERELEAHMECLWYLFSKVPSLKRPGRTVLDETREFNCREPISSHWRVIEKQGLKAKYDSLRLPNDAARHLLRLLVTPETEMQDKSMRDCFSPSFFESNFWHLFSSMLSFDDYHSGLRSAVTCQVHAPHAGDAAPGRDLAHRVQRVRCPHPPPHRLAAGSGGALRAQPPGSWTWWLTRKDGETTVIGLTVQSAEGRSEIVLTAEDFVLLTNGSLTQNTTYGDNETAVTWNLDRQERGLFTLWEKLAALDPKFGRPEKFISWPEKTRWTSFFVTVVDYPNFADYIEKVSGDKRGNGGAVTVKDSSWGLGFICTPSPSTPTSPTTSIFWGYGLRGNSIGDYVKKPMVDCTGNEVLAEFLYHLGLEDSIDDFTAHAKVSLAGMPYITSQFMPGRSATVPE